MAAGDGLISMTPTSIAYSGTSASINADGGVDFSAVTSLSLNGVFTSDYDNYLISFRWDNAGSEGITLRLRASGTDNSAASSYTGQRLDARSTSVTGARVTGTNAEFVYSGADPQGSSIHVYGPFLAQPTAMRSVNHNSISTASLIDFAITHNVSSAFDGFTFATGDAITGTVHVFGYEE